MPKSKTKSKNRGKSVSENKSESKNKRTGCSEDESVECSDHDSLDLSIMSASCQSEINTRSESEEGGVLSEGVEMLSLPNLTPIETGEGNIPDNSGQISVRKRTREDQTLETEVQSKMRRTELNNSQRINYSNHGDSNNEDFPLIKSRTIGKSKYQKNVQMNPKDIEGKSNQKEQIQSQKETRINAEESNYSLSAIEAGCSIQSTESSKYQSQDTEEIQEDSIIIIEPKGHPEEVEQFLGSDVRTARAIAKTNFKLAAILDIRKNHRRKHLVVKIKGKDEFLIRKLLEINEIGNQTVQCRIPKEHTYSCGVIGPVGIYTTAEEIVEDLESNGYINPEAVRLIKGREKEPSAHIKITFKTENLPEHVYIGYQRYQVRPYVNRPFQCYQCQGFGHSAADCRRGEKCLICAGAHNYKSCNRENIKKCSNCGENHTSTFSGCKAMKMATLVEKTKVERKITYSEAVTIVKKNSNQRQRNPNIMNYAETLRRPLNLEQETYEETVPPSRNQKQSEHLSREISTQTESKDENPETFDSINNNTQDNEAKTIPRWAAFMIQIITIKEITNHKEKCLALTKSLEKILGIKASHSEIEEFLTPPSNTATGKEKIKGIKLLNKDGR